MLTILARPARSVTESLRALRVPPGGHVLALTFFADAGPDALLAEVAAHFGGDPPPAGVVAQPPDARGRLALEATVRAPDDARVLRRTHAGVRYTVVEGDGFREVHCRGLRSDPALGDAAARSHDALGRMAAVLRAEGLHFGHVVRQWAYIEGLLDGGGASYQAFNDARAVAYAGSPFPAGYPAATGIGQAAGGVVLDFVALDAPGATITPLSNPRQTDAHHYSRAVLAGEGRWAPKFERAKRIRRGGTETILVSGTAAIVGERSIAPGDVAAQTATTIANIRALTGSRRLSRLRAYVKRAADFPAVRRLCAEAFGNVPGVYVQADICRPELLVEIEGALVRPA